MSTIAQRLEAVRKQMTDSGVDALLVRSTDRYLNEYVPVADSMRIWISGFTGSMGEVIVTPDKAFLTVDGRYWIQAEQETDPALWTIIKVKLGTGIDAAVADQLKQLIAERKAADASRPLVIGFEPAKLTPSELEQLRKNAGEGAEWTPLHPSPVERARELLGKNGDASAGAPAFGERPSGGIRVLDEVRVGTTVEEKLAQIAPKIAALGVDAVLIQRLDEIAYLTNLRGDELPYQATFKSIALLCPDRIVVALEPSRITPELRERRRSLELVESEDEVWRRIGGDSGIRRVGFDRASNTEHARLMIERAGAAAVSVESPVGPLKAKKNPAELAAMVEAFARADVVVDAATRWLSQSVVKGSKVSEADFAQKVRELFEESGATGLSFKIISAAGKNGAIIHYSDPNPRRLIKRGELMLLDTGAYYDEGYATDLTRTFLVDAPSAKGSALQRKYYTLTLKAAIAGMTAVIPEGTRGYQLDAITRAPLWAAGLDYNHGTGHGVGVNVHEFPPRIGPQAQAPLEEGFVFSIEPGVYLPSFGGIRIENLCTLKKAPKAPGFLAVEPLTFSPLDKRLIDAKLLTPAEKAFLASFSKVHDSAARRRLRSSKGSSKNGAASRRAPASA